MLTVRLDLGVTEGPNKLKKT